MCPLATTIGMQCTCLLAGVLVAGVLVLVVLVAGVLALGVVVAGVLVSFHHHQNYHPRGLQMNRRPHCR